MRRWIAGILLLQICCAAQAKEYGHYDISKVISVAGAQSGQHTATINIAYLTQMLDDLGSHASGYPPQFDSPEDRQRAQRDVSLLSKMLDTVAEHFSHDPPMLMRLAMLHAYGHNLDIPGSDEQAEATFKKLLELAPNDPQSNFRCGMFYAQTATKRADAIPYLEKAKALGVQNADYWLGITYMTLGDKPKAIENLKSYTSRVPTDARAAAILDAVQHDKVKLKEGMPPASGLILKMSLDEPQVLVGFAGNGGEQIRGVCVA
jgi:tetratricopeptide (TPR) repeat protein